MGFIPISSVILGSPNYLLLGSRCIRFKISLGTHRLAKGNHQLTVEIVGANPKAVKAYMFGIDVVAFHSTHDPKIAFSHPKTTEPLYPHASLSPAEAVKNMKLPAGFSVQVGAAEPDVRQPTRALVW